MNRLHFGHIMAHLLNAPLAVHPRTAIVFYNALCGRFGASPAELPDTPDAQLIDERLERVSAKRTWELLSKPSRANAMRASQFAGTYVLSEDGQGVEPYRVHKGVGIVPVMGELVNRGAWVGARSGMTSYEGLKFQLSRMAADNRVSRVLLDIDSPGGEGIGMDVASAAVRELNAQKPVTAVVNGLTASAAYGLASGAKRIVTTPMGVSGSIGVVLLHLDHSKEIEAAGISPTLIYAGAHKVDANPLEPLSDSTKSQLQADVDAYYAHFLTIVATGRAGRTSAKAARETEARTYIGQAAVDARLADDVGTFEEVLADMARKSSRSTTASPSRSKAMSRRMAPIPNAVLDDDDEPEINTGFEFEFGGVRFNDVTSLVAHVRGAAGAAALARISAILADDRSKGRERFSVRLACMSPDLSPDEVLELAAEARTEAPATRSLAERTADTNATAVTSQPDPNEGKPADKWGKIVAKTNENTKRAAGGKRTALSN